MAKKNASGEKKTPRKAPAVDDLKDPLLAAVGVLDLALEQFNEVIDAMRERAEGARSDASTRAQQTRERLTKGRQELRERLTAEELRDTYQNLTVRGQSVLARLRSRTSTETTDPKT